jgi:hypothetical protein
VVFLSDGGDSVCNLQAYLHPDSEHWLDWFHITMRISVLQQQVKTLKDEPAGGTRGGITPAGRSRQHSLPRPFWARSPRAAAVLAPWQHRESCALTLVGYRPRPCTEDSDSAGRVVVQRSTNSLRTLARFRSGFLSFLALSFQCGHLFAKTPLAFTNYCAARLLHSLTIPSEAALTSDQSSGRASCSPISGAGSAAALSEGFKVFSRSGISLKSLATGCLRLGLRSFNRSGLPWNSGVYRSSLF